MLASTRRQQGAPELHIGQRRCTTLADQIEGLGIGAQAQSLDDMPREARADIAGTGADHHRANLLRSQTGVGQRTLARLRSEQWRVVKKPF